MSINWTDIAQRDPYLAGCIACREQMEGDTPEATADSVGLVGDARKKFLLAWHDELVDAAQERNEQLERDAKAAIKEHGKLWGIK